MYRATIWHMVRAAVLLALSTASVAAADPVRLEVTSDRCDLGPVRAAVVALAGHDPFDDAAGRVIRVDGTQLSDAPIARIWFDDGHGGLRGPRVVDAASCAELVDAVALVVTMALPHDPPPRQEPDPEDQAPAELAETIAPARAPTGSIAVLVGAAVTARDSLVQAFVGARWKRDARSITGIVRHDSGETLAVSQMGLVEIGRTDVVVSPCLLAGALAGCVVAGIGVISGSGEHLEHARSAVSPAAFTGVAAEWRHPLGPWLALRAHVEADAMLTSTTLDVDEMPVWTSSRVQAQAGLGFLVRFP